VLSELLPEFLKVTPNTPVFRNLRCAGRMVNDQIDVQGLHPSLVDAAAASAKRFQSPLSVARKAELANLNVTDVVTKYEPQYAVHYIPWLHLSHINVNELQTFLRSNMQYFLSKSNRTSFRKLVCFYDLLRNGPGATSGR
jgi:hypothetical protein